MQQISLYEILELFPLREMRLVGTESVHRHLMEILPQQEKICQLYINHEAYEHACAAVYTQICDIESKYTVKKEMQHGFYEYCAFWKELTQLGKVTDATHKYYNTFLNYMGFAQHVHSYAKGLNKRHIKIVELGAGYGFSSYALTCLGYMVLGLSSQGRSSWHSWLMDRFMMQMMPITFKDSYAYSMGTLSQITQKFSGVDVFCLSGVPAIPTLGNIADACAYVYTVLMEFMQNLNKGGYLVCSNMCFFSCDGFSPPQRKAALLETIKLLEGTQKVRCLSFTAGQEDLGDFPQAWKGFDLGLVLSKI